MAIVAGELSADGQRIILVAEGQTHELARAAAALTWLTPKVRRLAGGLELDLSWPAVVQLQRTFGPMWRPSARLAAWTQAQLQARLVSDRELDLSLPPGLVPRSYQWDGARMIGDLGSVLLFDEPGVGKTVTTVLGLRDRAQQSHPVLPVIVVAPLSVVDSWVRHVHDWSDGAWRAVAWRGSPPERAALAGTADVYVTSYGTARNDAMDHRGPLMRLNAPTLVCDEMHQIKNPQAQQSLAVRRLAARGHNFIGLSGTPITHSPADLWPALVALHPGAWPSRDRWVKRYCTQIWTAAGPQIGGLDPRAEAEFRVALLGQERRVAKADVLTELPPKIFSVRQVELPPRWRKTYDELSNALVAQLPDGGEISVLEARGLYGRLSQLSSAAADVEEIIEVDEFTGEPKVRLKLHLRAPSWKVDALLEVLAERPGQPVVCFAPSRQLIMLAGQTAAASGYRVGYVVGGQRSVERTATVDAFQAGELDLLCLTTGAGGVGLTLTRSKTVVFLQRPWSLVESLQAEDRCHRIGSEQHDCVEVIDVVATNTIDSKVRRVLKQRAGALSELVQDPRIVSELFGGRVRVT